MAILLLSGCGGGGDSSPENNNGAGQASPPGSSSTVDGGNSGTGNGSDNGGNSGNGSNTGGSNGSNNGGNTEGGNSSNNGAETPSSPTVSWNTPEPITYGQVLTENQLRATANADGRFSYSPALGTKLDAGTHALTATFTPSSTTAASPITKTVTLVVKKANPVIAWDKPQNAAYGSWLSGKALRTLTTTDGNPNNTLKGTSAFNAKAGDALNTIGDKTLTVDFTPDDAKNYNAIRQTQTITVVRADPSTEWLEPAPIAQGTALSAAQLNARARYGITGSFTYSPPQGTVMTTVGSQVLRATFTPSDTNYKTITITNVLTVVPQAGQAAVDFSKPAQTIRGFGASDAWYSKMENSQIQRLYGQNSSDLGLSIMRVRIAPATWDNTQKAVRDTDRWVPELDNAKAAQNLGATVFATPWTAPEAMKTNSTTFNDKRVHGNLATARYADYANYLNTYVQFAASKGVKLYGISMQNEPDYAPDDPYESSLWSADGMASWAASYGAQAVRASEVKLIAPESYGFNPEMTDILMDNAAAANNIGIIGGHLYGATPYYPRNPKLAGKEIWMTEHFHHSENHSDAKGATWRSTLNDAIKAATEIHASMAIGQHSAYVWWWLVNSNDDQPRGLISKTGNPTYFGYAMKHFARFIRPDYQRYDATAQPVPGVYLSAYAAPDKSRTVLVLINSTQNDVTLPVALRNTPAQGAFTLYRTHGGETFANKGTIPLTGTILNAVLPARSISTYAQ